MCARISNCRRHKAGHLSAMGMLPPRWLRQAEARRGGLDPGRMQDVRKALGSLLTEVEVGSELLYDELPASSLDGQGSKFSGEQKSEEQE